MSWIVQQVWQYARCDIKELEMCFFSSQFPPTLPA